MCGIIIFQGREEKKISMSPVGASCFSVLYSQLSITKKRWKKSLWHQPSSHPSSYVFAWTAHAVKYPWNTVHSKYKPQPTPFYWPPYTHPKVPTDKIHLKAAKLSRTSQPKVEIPPPPQTYVPLVFTLLLTNNHQQSHPNQKSRHQRQLLSLSLPYFLYLINTEICSFHMWGVS